MNPAGTSARRSSAPRTNNVAHPGLLIRRITFIVAPSRNLLAHHLPGLGGILAFFGALRTCFYAIAMCIQFVVHDEHASKMTFMFFIPMWDDLFVAEGYLLPDYKKSPGYPH
jgi:hypothetical protein